MDILKRLVLVIASDSSAEEEGSQEMCCLRRGRGTRGAQFCSPVGQKAVVPRAWGSICAGQLVGLWAGCCTFWSAQKTARVGRCSQQMGLSLWKRL